jgi:hypothetical protein
VRQRIKILTPLHVDSARPGLVSPLTKVIDRRGVVTGPSILDQFEKRSLGQRDARNGLRDRRLINPRQASMGNIIGKVEYVLHLPHVAIGIDLDVLLSGSNFMGVPTMAAIAVPSHYRFSQKPLCRYRPRGTATRMLKIAGIADVANETCSVERSGHMRRAAAYGPGAQSNR